MRTQILSLQKAGLALFILLMLSFAGVRVNAQCYTCGSQYPSGTYSTTSTGWTTLSSCVYGGEWSLYNINAGYIYQWSLPARLMTLS
jgi:hypothetical protein